MPTSPLIRHTVAGLALLCVPFAAQADWSLDKERSSLHFFTTKAGAITELNFFSELEGSIADGGLAVLNIGLASIDSMIPIRDERMRNILFRTNENPLATVEVDVSQLDLAALPVGTLLHEDPVVALTLNGVTNSVETELTVTVLEGQSVLVSSRVPLVIDAGRFGLAEGVEELREIAGLPSINHNVVVGFSVVYKRN